MPARSSRRCRTPRATGTAINRQTTTSHSSWCALFRPDRLAHHEFRFAFDQIILQLSDRFVSQPFVQRTSAWIERRDAEEDIRRLPENAPFGEFDEACADTVAARIAIDANGLDVADESAVQV